MPDSHDRAYHPALEEYCEAIFELQEDDVEVIQARIAERLGVSRPAVSEMIKRLTDEGYVRLAGAKVTLTNSGRRVAETVVRRHRLAERFLTDVLGLSWAEAHDEAGKWEHVISDSVEQALDRLLGSPTTCPHGNPIPGSDYRPPNAIPLRALDPETTFTVARIPEELEFTPGLLEFLEAAGVQPGMRGRLTSKAPDGTVTVIIDRKPVGIGEFAAARILVTVASDEEVS
jgi:DtxR family Mn-dependent transcriptional regulator